LSIISSFEEKLLFARNYKFAKVIDFAFFDDIIIMYQCVFCLLYVKRGVKMFRYKKKLDMTEGPFLKKMVLFAIPMILTGLLQSLYNAADLVVVGQFRGDMAVAAVGSTGALTNLIVGLFMGLSVGSGVLVAHYIGAKQDDEVKKVVHTSVIVSAVLGVIISIIGFFLSGKFLELMGTPADVLPGATLYLKIIFLGVPASMMYNYIAAMLRSAGDSQRPLIFLTISGLVNIALNIVLVTAFGMGVDGVAIATIISQYLSAIMAFVYLMKTSGVLRLSFSQLKVNFPKVKRMLYIGIPSGIQSSLFSLSNVVIQSSVNSLGANTTAGSAAASNIEAFVYIAMNAIYHVSLTFIGQNVGAKKYKNIRRIIVYCVLIVSVIGIGLGALGILFRYPLIKLYVSEEAAIASAMARFMIIMPTYFLCGIMDVLCGTLRALDRSLTAMIVSLVGACGLRIVWLSTVFVWYPTEFNLYIIYPISWIITCAFHLLFIIIAARKLPRQHTA